MATEYVMEPFLDAKGRKTVVGAKAPDESKENLDAYRRMGLIGSEKEVEAANAGVDAGRPGKAATSKKTGKAATS